MCADTIQLKPYVYIDPAYQEKLRKELNHYLGIDSLAAFRLVSKRSAFQNRSLLEHASDLSSPITYFYDLYNKQSRQWRQIERYRSVISKAQSERSRDSMSKTNDYFIK
jgi:hypothetical protein